MIPSNKAINLIKGYEKCRLKAYMPTPKDRPTIGWGTTGSDVKMGMTWTQEQADDRFSQDLMVFSRAVEKALKGKPTTQNQFDALVSFAYNVGMGDTNPRHIVSGLLTSTLLRKHLLGDFNGALAEFPKWNKQKGTVLGGLVRRRADEACLYKGT